MGTFLGLSRWAQRNHKSPQKEKQEYLKLATRDAACYLPASSRRRKGP